MTTSMQLLAALGEVNDLYPSGEALWRVLAAAGFGAIVGFEREVADQPAGLRTHITVALGAAVFGVISTLGFSEFVTDQRDVNVQFDVTRVASQVVVGIGFLGAGVIFRAGSKVRNLTTAASLWVTAALGLAAGVGDIGMAAFATVVLLVALLLLKIPRDAVRSRFTRQELRVSIGLRQMEDADAVLDAIDENEELEVLRIGWAKRDGRPILDLTLEGHPSVRPQSALRPIVGRQDVVWLRSEWGISSPLGDGETA